MTVHRCDRAGSPATGRGRGRSRGRSRGRRRRWRVQRLGRRCPDRVAGPPSWRAIADEQPPPARRFGRRREERGAIGAVETMLAVPMIGVLVVSVFQVALLWHAHNIVEAAAQEGSQAAAVINRTCTDGIATANDMADRLGGAYVNAVSVTCQPGATVTVTVVGQALSMVPGLHFPVRASADAATAGER